MSPSGTGLHLIARGRIAAAGRRRGPFEIYEAGRYVTLTGQRLPGTPARVEERQGAISALHASVFQEAKAKPGPGAKAPEQQTVSLLPDDEELLERAFAAKNGDKFAALWAGDYSAYRSVSEADLALCSSLAFWAGPDPQRIDRLFRQSGLLRPKWNRKDYRDRTITRALQGRTAFYGTANMSHHDTTPLPWEPPIPLDGEIALPVFPVACLPDWLRTRVTAEAEATQTPPDLAAMLALAILGAAMARKFRVLIRPGWDEPSNLSVVAALPPGERKSAVFADAMKPVFLFEHALREEMAPTIAKLASEHRMLSERLKEIEKKVARASDIAQIANLKAQALQLAEELAAHHVPEQPQVYCDDETPESLNKLLAQHGGRMLQASAEGTAFEIAKGKYSETPNFDVYLKGHAGDPLRVGRISRSGDEAERPALSVALAVQPDVIQGLAEHASMRGRGFLARWFYALPTRRVGSREVAPPPVPESVSEAYRQNVLALWGVEAAEDEAGKPVPHVLEFSGDADQALREFAAWLEPQLREGEALSLLAGWANKLAGGIARLAGILHIAEALDHGLAFAPIITAATVEAAIQIGRDYLLPHAQAAFGLMGADRRVLLARRVIKWLTNSVNSVNFVKGGSPFIVSQKAIHTGIGGATCSAEELSGALLLLQERDYLQPATVTSQKQGPGRTPGPRYEVNPGLYPAPQTADPAH